MFERGVRAAAFQAVVVQQLAKLVGLLIPAVIAGKLDALIAHLADGLDAAGEIFRKLVAEGIELEGDRDFLLGFFGAEKGRCEKRRGGGRCTNAENVAAGMLVGHVGSFLGSTVVPTALLFCLGMSPIADPEGEDKLRPYLTSWG